MDLMNCSSAWFRALKTVKLNESTRLVHCRVIDCPKRFLDEATTLEHYKTHLKLFRCSECNDLYCSKQGVYDHFEEKHVTAEKRKTKEVKEEKTKDGEKTKEEEAPKVSNATEKMNVSTSLPIDASTIATLSDDSID